MLGSKARRSLDAAAAKHLNLRFLADGLEESCQIAGQQPKDRAKNAQIQLSYATLQDGGGEISQAVSSADRREYVGNYDSRLAIAAKMIAAHLARTAMY